MSKFLITTTPVLEGYSIKRYLGAINTNIVLGTNFFSDFAASFTDVFGGTSDTYQGKMDLMYDKAKKQLIKKAQTLGGNAIVGFSTNFDEISGKGKSMFMLSVSGTACIVEYPQKEDTVSEMSNGVDSYEYECEIKKQDILQKIKDIPNSLVENDWNFIMEHLDNDIIEALVKDQYVREDIEGRQKIESLLSAFEYDDVVNMVYPLYMNPYIKKRQYVYGPDVSDEKEVDVSEKYVGMINNCKLFNATQISKLIDNDVNKAIDILNSTKPYYTLEDINEMRLLCEKFDNLPDVGHKEVSKGGMFSKEKEIFVCQHGHKNDADREFCETCFENIKGIQKRKIDKIDDYKKKVEILEHMINREH